MDIVAKSFIPLWPLNSDVWRRVDPLSWCPAGPRRRQWVRKERNASASFLGTWEKWKLEREHCKTINATNVLLILQVHMHTRSALRLGFLKLPSFTENNILKEHTNICCLSRVDLHVRVWWRGNTPTRVSTVVHTRWMEFTLLH